MKTLPTIRLLLGLFAATVSAVLTHGGVVQANFTAITRSTSALVGINSAGQIRRSIDNGSSFTTAREPSATALNNVSASGDTVIAVGGAGFIVRSTNGGSTWADATSPTFAGELRDAAANGSFWVAVGRNNQNVTALWSSDGGATWTVGTTPTVSGTLKGVTFDASTSRWCAVGTDGVFTARILTSTDGKTWTSVTAPSGALGLTDVATNTQGRLLAVGEGGTVLVSTNGGLTFAADANSGIVSENLNSVVYSSTTSSWLAGGVDLVQLSYTAANGLVVTQEAVGGGGNILALAVDANGAAVITGTLAGYQTITFAGPANQNLNAGSVVLSASASSGLPVSFELLSGPATLSGATVTFTAAGTITVRAVQTGNVSYNAAASVTRSFDVIATATGFDTWRQQYFSPSELLNDAVSGVNATPAADGVPNLVKYALGLAPKTIATSGLPTIAVSDPEFVFTFQTTGTLSDVTLRVQVWTTDFGAATEVQPSLVSTNGSIKTWEVRRTVAPGGRAFFRLKVSRNAT